MKIRCFRTVLLPEGIAEISFVFDTENLEIEFAEKDYSLLEKIAQGVAIDLAELTEYEKET